MEHSLKQDFVSSRLHGRLLLYLQDRVLSDAKFAEGFGWNLDLLLAMSAFLFCFTKFPKPGTTNSPFF
jgi:hypothetical protein